MSQTGQWLFLSQTFGLWLPLLIAGYAAAWILPLTLLQPVWASAEVELKLSPSHHQTPPSAAAETPFSEKACLAARASLRSSLDPTVIRLGRFKDKPYVVAVPGRRRDRLEKARQCVPDALILPSRRGQYIHVASFASRACAENLGRVLRRAGLDARVAYFH